MLMFGTIELSGPPIFEDCVRFGSAGYFTEHFALQAPPNLCQRGSFRIGSTQPSWQLRSQDSILASRYSFRSRNFWLTKPVA